MSDRDQRGRPDDRSEEKPPYSRIFIVCSKNIREPELRVPFEKFGTIENIHMPRDRGSGESKGVAFIKYAKTSSAAAAIKEYHMKTIGGDHSKPVKVMIACNRNGNTNHVNEDKSRRLFIIVSKDANEAEVREHFSQFGNLESVFFQKDKNTNEKRGFAYVTYETFLDTAIAYEECDRKYKPVFATPKEELKRSRNSFEHLDSAGVRDNETFHSNRLPSWDHNINPRSDTTGRLSVMVVPQLPQRYLERLFNILPGLDNIQYSVDNYNGRCTATVTYHDHNSATLAVERLNKFEFPSGEIVYVKPDNNPLEKAASDLKSIVDSFKNAMDCNSSQTDLVQLADAIAHASSLIKAATSGSNDQRGDDPGYCSVKLPPPQPLRETAAVVQRCFVVCKPHPPPLPALKDVFRRFGDLIDVNIFPNKTYGFARYASADAAKEAINVLHGATVCGVRLKVLEADDRQIDKSNDSKRKKIDTDDFV